MNTLTPPVPEFVFCRRVGSQPIHTSTFELYSVASELVEYRSTSAAERDDVASVAHLVN